MSHYVPSVRGDALLVTRGRTGGAEDLLLISSAVVLDGVLGGHIDVTGNRRFGVERRRIAPGPAVPGAPAAEAAARARLADVLTGRPAPPHALALACALHACERLDAVAGVRPGRRRLRAMADASRTLAPGVQAVLATLDEHRRRAAQIAA